MLNLRFAGTVTLRESVRGPLLVAWRQDRKRLRRVDGSGVATYVPYDLALYLCLMPKGNTLTFSNRLYDFTNKDLRELQTDNHVVRITKRNGDYILKINL